MQDFRACAVIPVYNHDRHLPGIVARLRGEGLPVIVVDDGCDARTRAVLARLAAADGVECIALAANRGKGAAVLAGVGRAAERGFSHALQVDADGQHDLTDVPALLELARKHPDCLVSGAPVYDRSIPAVRFYARYLTHALVWLDTLSRSLRDSMCGFRVYPVARTVALADAVHLGFRMDFDPEVMVRLYWAGTESVFLPTRVRYPAGGVSHFRMVRDNLRMIALHLRLLAGLWPRIPALLARRRKRRTASHWARIAERGNWLGLHFAQWADRTLGRRACSALLAPAVLYFMFVHARARAASRDFLAAAGIAPSFSHRYRQLMNFTGSILDKAKAWRDPTGVDVDVSDCRQLMDDYTAGRGVLMIGAHLGNMEAARAFGQRLPGVRVTALVHTRNSRMITSLLQAANADYALDLLQVDDVGPDTAVLLKQRIDAGQIVVIAGDRVPVGEGGQTVEARFFGRNARFAMGPYVLAHVLQCPVYLFFCVREEGGYKMYVERLAERIELPRRGRRQAVAAWAARYVGRLEAYARRFPLQWYNFYDVWAEAAPTADGAAMAGGLE